MYTRSGNNKLVIYDVNYEIIKVILDCCYKALTSIFVFRSRVRLFINDLTAILSDVIQYNFVIKFLGLKKTHH